MALTVYALTASYLHPLYHKKWENPDLVTDFLIERSRILGRIQTKGRNFSPAKRKDRFTTNDLLGTCRQQASKYLKTRKETIKFTSFICSVGACFLPVELRTLQSEKQTIINQFQKADFIFITRQKLMTPTRATNIDFDF